MSRNGLPEIVVVSGARTPMAEWISGKRGDGLAGGALASVSAIDLGAAAAKAALERGGVPAEAIDHVVMGNAMQTSSDAIYGARHVALKAGIAKRGPGAHRQPSLWLRPPERRHRRAADPDRRGELGDRGRDGEHESGPARDPRRARRPPASGRARSRIR